MLTPIAEGGGGMSSAEVSKWAVYFKIQASNKKQSSGSQTTSFGGDEDEPVTVRTLQGKAVVQ